MRRAGDIRIRKLPCRIESIDKPAPDVAIVRLKLPANERLQFLAGQYIDFLLKDGRRRSFSLATPPHDDALLELHVRHVPGGLFTDQLFSEFKGREILRFEGPLGTFFLREDSDKPIIFVAGGTGFAPIKAIIEHALHHQLDATRPMVLYWGARAKRDLYLPDLPGKWQQEHPQLHVHPGAVRARARRRLARPHRARPPGGAGRLRRPVRLSGLRLRRAGDDRRRTHELHRSARDCRRRSSSPTASPTRCSRRPPTRPAEAGPTWGGLQAACCGAAFRLPAAGGLQAACCGAAFRLPAVGRP